MRCHEKWVESKEKKNISMKYTGKKCLNFDTVSIISLTIKKYWIGSGKWKVRSGDPGKGLSEHVDIPRMKINLYQFQGQKKKNPPSEMVVCSVGFFSARTMPKEAIIDVKIVYL